MFSEKPVALFINCLVGQYFFNWGEGLLKLSEIVGLCCRVFVVHIENDL